jgi:predicted RNA binding protein YcfA (HicA-like mRNA interferase family)
VSKLPRITGKEAVGALKRAGFALIRVRGSHHYLYHDVKARIVTVPVHAGETLAPKTLQSILAQAGLTVEEFSVFL